MATNKAARQKVSPTPYLNEDQDFSLVLGDPIFQLLRKSHLEGDGLELLHRRVIASVLITWIPLLLLSLLGVGAEKSGRISFFHDVEAHARFLVALPVLIFAELIVHSRIQPAVRRFVQMRIVLPEDLPLFRKQLTLPFAFATPFMLSLHCWCLCTRQGSLSGMAGENSRLPRGTHCREVGGT